MSYMKFGECLRLIGKGLAYENVTKAKTSSAGRQLLNIAPQIDDLEKAATEAASLLISLADELKLSSTVNGEWDGSEEAAKKEYDTFLRLASLLSPEQRYI